MIAIIFLTAVAIVAVAGLAEEWNSRKNVERTLEMVKDARDKATDAFTDAEARCTTLAAASDSYRLKMQESLAEEERLRELLAANQREVGRLNAMLDKFERTRGANGRFTKGGA